MMDYRTEAGGSAAGCNPRMPARPLRPVVLSGAGRVAE